MRDRQLTPLMAGFCLAAAAFGSQTEASATTTDYIVNGTFSDPNYNQQTGWTETGAYYFDHNAYYLETSGSSHPGSQTGSLNQNVLDVAGGTDTLSFNILFTSTLDFEFIEWNNSILARLQGDYGSLQHFTPHTYNVTATGHDTLTFLGNNDFAITSTGISDVALVPTVTEPEPAAMLLIGMGLIGWMARRKAASNA
ncbi:MAG: PEP-CTERM sorting domain-containing protein [Burkholderiales bacterium]